MSIMTTSNINTSIINIIIFYLTIGVSISE